jgi:hypothetical protein
MKKLLATSLLALTVLAGTEQSASAWCHFKFGIGLNMEFSSGNNCTAWGLFRNGQYPDGMGYPMFAGPMSDWYAPAPAPVSPTPDPKTPRPGSSYGAPGSGYAAGYYPAPYYYPQAGYYANYQYGAYRYASYPSANPFNYYLMSYPGSMNFYGN